VPVRTSSSGGQMRVGRGSLGLRLIAGLIIALSAFLSQAGGATAAAPTFLGSFGPDGTSASNFQRAGSVAVDEQLGDVYVLDVFAHTLYKFDSEGEPVAFTGSDAAISGNTITGLPVSEERGLSQVAVDSQTHTIYVTGTTKLLAFGADGEPAEFTAGPGAGTSEIGGFGELTGVAVDLNGNIYVSDATGGVSIFTRSGEEITNFSTSNAANLAVAADGSVYVNHFAGTVTKWTPSEQPVASTTTFSPAADPVDTEETLAVAVDVSTGDVYLTHLTSGGFRARIVVYDESGAFVETFAGPGEEGELFRNATGIGINAATETIYASSAGFSDETFSQVRIFGPERVGPPSFAEVFAAEVTSDSALLNAVIDPNGAATTYQFQYGLGDCSTTVCTSVSLGENLLGEGQKKALVSELLAGLTPNTTYHFRIVAENSFGPEASADHIFLTQSGSLSFLLEDSRAWEMISPPNKNGGSLTGSAFGLIQGAANGEGLVYASRGSIERDPDGNRSLELSNVLARRTDQGWQSEDVTPPSQQVISVLPGAQSVYSLFTENLGAALLDPRDSTQLSTEASERTPYLRENSTPPVYTPLVTGKEGFANVPPGTEFGGDPKSAAKSLVLVGANASLSRPIISSEVPLRDGAPPNGLYAWSQGQLLPVSVLPGEGGMTSASLVGSGAGSVRNAVPDDGSRIFWAPGSYGNGGNGLSALYMRDLAAEETVRLDSVQGGTGEGSPRPAFQAANADGTVAYFTDSQQLTPDASAQGRDLYRCEIPAGAPSSKCILTNVSAAIAGSGESAEVEGLAPGVSEDGKTVYFIARGVLDSSAGQNGEEAETGQPNLYVWQEGHNGVRFIAKLSDKDESAWGGPFGLTSELVASASPSGRYFAFMSQRSLTGYNNREAETGHPVYEVFQYDSSLDELQCISCNPSGAAPSGQIAGQIGIADVVRELVDPRESLINRWLGAALPEPTIINVSGLSLYQPRGVLDDGRVFFNGFDSIVPRDSNGQWDVYQYEPLGVGTCSESSSGGAVARSGEGCVSLLSSGTGSEESGFLDASTSGADVFFLTSAKLSVLDEDSELDVYDARVNGISAIRSTVEGCSGEGCRSTGAPPSAALPGSSTFQGAGNIRQGKKCPKGKRKVKQGGKTRCVKPKHQKHKKHRKHAGHNGRQGK
jgi:hypothetical protein